MDAESLKNILVERGITEVPICDMDAKRNLLLDCDGRAFREIATNLWATGKEDIAYLGTGRHGGGIILRAMFLRIGDDWYNVVTGRKALFRIDGDGSASSPPARRVLETFTTSQKLQMLRDVCRAFSWSERLSDIYTKVCRVIGAYLDTTEVHMHLMNHDYTRLMRRASLSEGDLHRKSEGNLSSGVGRIEWIKETKAPIFMNYEQPDPHDEISPLALEAGLVSALSFPICTEKEVIGLITTSYPYQTRWSEDDLEFFKVVGEVIGACVERLYDTKKAEQLSVISERKLLSTEIHENISSLIGALSVNAAAAMEACHVGNEEVMLKNLERLEKTSSETMRTLRDEMLSLRISLEKTDGLVEGIKQSLGQVEANWGLETSLVFTGDESEFVASTHISIQLTRILNECISNVIRHAEATRVTVTLAKESSALVMVVKDDGAGFDMDSIEPGHFGLKIMRERAENAGGTLSIKSGFGGTTVRIEVPFI